VYQRNIQQLDCPAKVDLGTQPKIVGWKSAGLEKIRLEIRLGWSLFGWNGPAQPTIPAETFWGGWTIPADTF
jgi:hypothetical protein